MTYIYYKYGEFNTDKVLDEYKEQSLDDEVKLFCTKWSDIFLKRYNVLNCDKVILLDSDCKEVSDFYSYKYNDNNRIINFQCK